MMRSEVLSRPGKEVWVRDRHNNVSLLPPSTPGTNLIGTVILE
jgi:hypothetical protein